MKFALTILIIFLFKSFAFASFCDSSLLVEEINLSAADSYEQERVLLSAEEGKSIVCQKNPNYLDVFKRANLSLKTQRKNLLKFKRLGFLIDGEFEYYSKFFDLISKNLKICQNHVRDLQTKDIKKYKTFIRFFSRSDGVSQINVYHQNGSFAHSYRSHLQWLGKIIYDEGRHLCETQITKI